MIPKILFTYWEGDQLSWFHYYTIYSIHKYNPDSEICIYTSENPSGIFRQWTSGEHKIDINKTISLNKILDINPNKIKLKKIDFTEEYFINNNISCIYKADFTRIIKLYEHGGVWFDMDILFIKPMPDFLFTKDIDMYLFTYYGTVPTGFIACKPKCELITNLKLRVLEIIQSNNFNNYYQLLGPQIWREECIKCSKNNIVFLEEAYIYPFLYDNIDNFFNNITDNTTIPNFTFGIHWYNGCDSTKKFINSFNNDNIDPERSLFEKYIIRLYD